MNFINKFALVLCGIFLIVLSIYLQAETRFPTAKTNNAAELTVGTLPNARLDSSSATLQGQNGVILNQSFLQTDAVAFISSISTNNQAFFARTGGAVAIGHGGPIRPSVLLDIGQTGGTAQIILRQLAAGATVAIQADDISGYIGTPGLHILEIFTNNATAARFLASAPGLLRLTQQSNCDTLTPGAVGEFCVQNSATCPLAVSTGTALGGFACVTLTTP